jgi:mRNA interferase HigB|tara:strand:- start:103 stop:399 length:297 start_codon:yes stop_codon:yes gene_type:complete
MRIIAIKKLKEFWNNGYSDSEQPLKVWYQIFKQNNFYTTHEVKRLFASASFVGNNRVVFNISGNKYRLVAHIRYDIQILFIRFIGTHAQYDKIDVTEV